MFPVLQFVFKQKEKKWKRPWNETIQIVKVLMLINEVTCQWPRNFGLVNKACPQATFINMALHLTHIHTLLTMINPLPTAYIFKMPLYTLNW